MVLTNETGLPIPVVRMAEKLVHSHPDMDEKRFSATETLKSVRQIVLGRKHGSEIVQDVQDTFSMWIGTAVHDALEKAGDDTEWAITETRLEAALGDFILSGEFDLLETDSNTLVDYKTTKVATIDKNRTLKEDKWLRQLYIYAWLLEKNGYERPKKGRIVAMAMDHSKVKARNQSGYPQHPIQILEWELDDRSYEEKVISEVLSTMGKAAKCLADPDEPIPECTYADCWCDEDYAVKKKGAQKALKKFGTEDEARTFYGTLGKPEEYRILHRVSGFINCSIYCQYAPFCSQWQALKDKELSMEKDITDEEYIPF